MAEDEKSGKMTRDLVNVMREEMSRGRKHLDTDAEEEQRQYRQNYLAMMPEIDDEDDFLLAISGLSLSPEQTVRAVDAWRELKRRRH